MSLSRRRRSLGALVTVISLLGGMLIPLPTAGASLDDGPAFVEPTVRNALGRTSALVHVEKEARVDDAMAAAGRAGLETGTVYEAIKVFVAYGDAAGFESLAASPAIEWIQANRRAQLFTNSSHKATRGQELLDGNVTLPDGTRIDGRGVGVAVVDSGIDGTHPDLVTRMGGNVKIICSAPVPIGWAPIGGFQQCRGPKTAVPMSDTDHPSAGGHGTHVAGTIAGTGTASNGLYHGAAPGATLYGVSVGTTLSVENGLDGLAWVLENHDAVTPAIKVVNNSWGSGYSRYQANGDPLYDATWKLQDALIAAGVTVVFAAGNSGGSGTAPTTSAQCINPRPGLICVANYDDKGTGTRAGTINSSSSRGKADQPENWPDLSAPGTSITATCRWTLPICHGNLGFVATPPNSYAVMTGTSMAAPHVAGIVAQLLQADPTLTPGGIENLLEDTAYKFAWGSAYGLYTDPTNPDDTSSFEKGHGLVDAVAAVQAALGGGIDPDPTPSETSSPTPTPTPTPSATSTPPTGTGATYYFHSASGLNTMDQAVGAEKPSFDGKFPTFDEYSVAYDVPGAIATGTTAAVDPIWHGQLGTAASTLSVDLWQKIQPAHAMGAAHYNVRVFSGGTFYDLYPLLDKDDLPLGGNSITRVQHTFTKMRPSGSTETDVSKLPALSLPAGSFSIAIRGYYTVDDALTEIRFDSKTYPSGFSVNGGATGPEPTPTETPTGTPTETPTEDPGPAATTLSFTDNSSESGQYTDNARLEAALTDTDTGAPIAGAEIDFEITGPSGTRSLSAVTDATGVAGSDFEILERPGQYVLTARYAGDEENYSGSADSGSFVVDREDSSTAVSLNGTSKAATVVATLTDADDATTRLAGQTIEFFVDGRSLGTAVTNGNGVASLDVPKKDARKADVYSAVFAGDAYFVGSSGTTRT